MHLLVLLTTVLLLLVLVLVLVHGLIRPCVDIAANLIYLT